MARRSQSFQPEERRAALSVRIELRAATAADAKREAPSEFRIFRAGLNPSEKVNFDTGEPLTFLFDDLAAQSVMEAYEAYGKPLALDYNHGTTYPFPSPDDAKAAGWFAPAVRDGELWATEIQWTPAGRESVESGEYGLFSPYFEHDGANPARVTRLINCALTNLPALNHLDLLATAASANGGADMPCADCTALSSRLSKMEEECSTLRAKLAAYEGKDEEMRASATLRADIVALTGQTNPQQAMGAIRAYREASERLSAVTTELDALKTKANDDAFKELLDAGVKDRKIEPGQRPFWEERCRSKGADGAMHATAAGVDLIKGYLATASARVPGVTPASAPGTSPTPPAHGYVLSAEDMRVAAMLGNDPAKVAEFMAKRAATGGV